MSDAVFIIGILTVAVFAAASYRAIKRDERHDRVVFAFNRLHSDLYRKIWFPYHDALMAQLEQKKRLPDHPGMLSRQEYEAARFLSRALDGITRHYHRHEMATLFNLRKMRRMIENDLRRYQEVQRDVRAKLSDVPPGTKIADLYGDFSRASAHAVLSYTPFIRAEVLLRLLVGDVAGQIAKIKKESEPIRGKFA